MAQNSRVAASSHTKMTRSTASINSDRITPTTEGNISPDGSAADILNGGASMPAASSTLVPNHETNDDQAESRRFWFPSVTTWYNHLNKVHAITVIILCYCNLINYMDRSTVAGMVSFIKEDKDFNVKSDKKLGLLQVLLNVCREL